MNTGRNFIGIEKDDHYFEVAKKRIETAVKFFGGGSKHSPNQSKKNRWQNLCHLIIKLKNLKRF